MFIRFQPDDIVPNQQETVTRALFSENAGTLTAFYSSSAESATQKDYYYEVFNSASTAATAEAQFSVAFGDRFGSGSASEGGQVDDTPSRAIYAQYRQKCLEPNSTAFSFNGETANRIYVINFNRARAKDSLDPSNVEINLRHLSGSEFLAGGGTNITHTGSNVTVGANDALRLVSDYGVNDPTLTSAGEVYGLVSGSIEDGVLNSSSPYYYGAIYPRQNVIIINADKLDLSASFGTVTGSDVDGDNAFKIFTAISASGVMTDASGDYLGMKARSREYVKSTHYFVRAKSAQLNFSNNPTFVTGSDGDLAVSTMIGNPTVYITAIGLYDEDKNLLAIAKTSQPIKKFFGNEALFEVKIDY